MNNASMSGADGAPPIGEELLSATVSFLNAISVSVDEQQFVTGLPIDSRDLSFELLERALKRFDLVLVSSRDSSPSGQDFPRCFRLDSGRYVVVLGKTDHGYQVVDSENRHAVSTLKTETLEPMLSGYSFKITESVASLQRKYSVAEPSGHWFWKRLFSEPSQLLDIVLSSLFANVLAIMASLFALQVYDRVIPAQSEATLWVLAGGVCIGILFEAWLRIARAGLIDQIGKKAEIEITRDLFAKMANMKLGRQPAPPSVLVHSMREFSAVKEFFSTASVGVVADLPFVFIFLGLIYGIAGPVMWVILIGALLTVIPSLLCQPKLAQLSRETQGGMSSCTRLSTEVAYGLETVKLSGTSSFFQKQWEEVTALTALKTTRQRAIIAFCNYWSAAVQQVTYVGAIIAGVYLVFLGDLTIGAMIAVGILSTRTLAPITQLSQVLSRWQNMKNALSGLDSIADSEQDRSPDRTYLRRSRLVGHLDFNSVEFAHPGSEHVSLKVQSFSVPAGSKIAIVGPNGSGKSTLLRIAAGLFEPSRGEIAVDGLDLRQVEPEDVRKNIGFVPQEVQLYMGTLRSNLCSDSLTHSDSHLYRALEFAGLAEFVRSRPEGLDTPIHEGGIGLSTGQKQSIGLARLFLQDPSVILLDEPTSALDQKAEVEMVKRLGNWIKGRTLIVATHRMRIAEIVDHIAVMQQGEIALTGQRDEILRKLSVRV